MNRGNKEDVVVVVVGLLLATSLLPKLETPAITDRQGFVHCYAS